MDNLQIDLVQLVRTAVANALEPTRISNLVNEAISGVVDKTLKDVLHSELRTYSDFGKQLENTVKSCLKLDPIHIPSYNHALTEFVRKTMEETSQSLIQQQVASRVKELMQCAPASIKLSELVEAYRKEREEEIEAGCTCEGDYEEIVVRLERTYKDSDILSNYWTLQFWESEDDKKAMYGDRDRPARVSLALKLQKEIPEGERKGVVQQVSYRDGETTKKMFVGPLYHFEKLCFNLQASKSEIIFDVDEESIQDLDLTVAESE